MAKKRKRTSVGSYAHHLSPASAGSRLNLSAYHPELDLSSLSESEAAEYGDLVQRCLVHPTMFADSMRKYWRQRFSLLSLYAAGCLLDEQSWYSITPEAVAFRIAKRCATDGTIVDLFAGAGGNAIQFAMTCTRVIAVELDPLKLRLARWNAQIYGVADRITFVQADSIQLLEALTLTPEAGSQELCKGLTRKDVQDVHAVFLSPPWGGVDYKNNELGYALSSLEPIDGAELFERVRKAFSTDNIAYYLPRHTRLQQLADLTHGKLRLKVEYQYVNAGTKLSSLTAYYGHLASDWNDTTDDWAAPQDSVWQDTNQDFIPPQDTVRHDTNQDCSTFAS